MASEGQSNGRKRSKAYYRKCAYGAKKHCTGINILEPGIRGFLVMCNHDERSAVRESYNILNEYADNLYGPDKNAGLIHQEQSVQKDIETSTVDDDGDDDDDDCDDMEKALKKEVEELKKASSSIEKRFQNVATKAKNTVFIRTCLENPMAVTSHIMEDIAEKHLKKARYAARILPILGTCKANTKDIEKLASDILPPIFSNQSNTSYTVVFKMRNNNGTSCGRESVVPALINVVKDINPDVKFSWIDYSTAIVVEVVCTVCCMGVAPDYFRLRKYNLQELQQGPKNYSPTSISESNEEKSTVDYESVITKSEQGAVTEMKVNEVATVKDSQQEVKDIVEIDMMTSIKNEGAVENKNGIKKSEKSGVDGNIVNEMKEEVTDSHDAHGAKDIVEMNTITTVENKSTVENESIITKPEKSEIIDNLVNDL